MSAHENAPLQRGAATVAGRGKIIPFAPNHSNIAVNLAWRISRGLQTLSDLSAGYEAIHSPRGCYSVSMPEDYV